MILYGDVSSQLAMTFQRLHPSQTYTCQQSDAHRPRRLTSFALKLSSNMAEAPPGRNENSKTAGGGALSVSPPTRSHENWRRAAEVATHVSSAPRTGLASQPCIVRPKWPRTQVLPRKWAPSGRCGRARGLCFRERAPRSRRDRARCLCRENRRHAAGMATHASSASQTGFAPQPGIAQPRWPRPQNLPRKHASRGQCGRTRRLCFRVQVLHSRRGRTRSPSHVNRRRTAETTAPASRAPQTGAA